jgi:pyruvate formate lyase activating enzyme
MKKAEFWKAEGEKIRCLLCPHKCLIADGKAGICRVRVNDRGVLKTSAYGEVISISVDPIEKKPLYHYYPGSDILSTGPRGCNLSCKFCQNWTISQADGPISKVSPKKLVEYAVSENSVGIAFTYTEPIIAFEYILDAGKIAHESGLVNVLITNGFINPEPFDKLLEVVDAMNIDLKSMEDDFYRDICGARLEPVMDTIRAASKSNAHVEITNLLIPGYNDSDDAIEKFVDFIASVDPLIPVHFSAYYPCYQFDAPPTPVETLDRAYDIARERLNYIYGGNRRTTWGNDTRCPQCGNLLVQRTGYSTRIIGISKDGLCENCGRKVDLIGAWSRSA